MNLTNSNGFNVASRRTVADGQMGSDMPEARINNTQKINNCNTFNIS